MLLSLENFFAKPGDCMPKWKEVEGKCVSGEIFVQSKPGVTFTEIEKTLSKYGLTIPLTDPGRYYWRQPSIQLWALENLESKNIPQSYKTKWDDILKDPIVTDVKYYPVEYTDHIQLKAIISFQDATTLEQARSYLESRKLMNHLSATRPDLASLESSWYTDGGVTDNFFYMSVPAGQEQRYVDLLKQEAIFEKVELFIFHHPHLDGGEDMDVQVPQINL